MSQVGTITETMKATVYKGAFDVAIEEFPVPKVEHPEDAVIKITTTAICGSDLHMYEGRSSAEAGMRFGHENMGIVIETGTGVSRIKRGDRVVLPFNVADGRCQNCEQGKTAFCTGVNPGTAGGAYGYVMMGPYEGGQAQYLRVPFADFNCLTVPPGTENEADFIMLADVFPTGWHGVVLSGFKPGETIVIFGGGPVGLLSAYSAILQSASKVYLVDHVPERLEMAKKIGCIAVDFTKEDAVEAIINHNGGMVDRSVDAVGYEATSSDGKSEDPTIVLEQCIKVTRPTGGIGVTGVYMPADPGAPNKNASEGKLLLSFGELFTKGLTISTGQADVKKYNRYLRDMIIAGKAMPSFIVTKEIGIEDVPAAYKKFDAREPGYTKVIVHPNGLF